MIKSINEKPKKIEVDLTGPEGNAFVLLGYAEKWSKQLGLDSNKIQEEMMEGDYDNLVGVMDKHFGQFVTFYK